MPCAKHIVLAFNQFAASLKLEHSAALSGVSTQVIPSFLAAVSFTIVMAFATAQCLQTRAWFLWALSAASLLQCAGFIASAVHSQDSTNHLAFLANFATITLAPFLLSIALITSFDRLRQAVMPESANNTWTGYVSQRIGTFILVPCLVPLAMFLGAIFNVGKFLSPAPIDDRNAAFARLLDYELGISQLEKAHAAQAVICVVFGILVTVFMSKGKSWKVDSLSISNANWRELLHTINFVNGLMLVRSCYKVYECHEIAASRVALGENGALFWLCDALPMLVALVVFCAVKPTSYLPQTTGRIVLDPEALYTDEKIIPDYSGAQF